MQIFLIVGGLFMCTISDGYIVGQLAGMIAAHEAKDSDVPLDNEEMSWIASTSNVTTLIGLAVTALVTEKFGRRKAITIISLPAAASWLAIYFAQRMLVFMIARIILGVCFGAVLSICVLSTAEYTAPNVRGFYLNMVVTAGAAIGVAISNILGILLHWRTVAFIGVVPTLISATLPFFWVESPTWLASKGRFDECSEAFIKLHGSGDAAMAELQLLIKIEMRKQNIGENSTRPSFYLLKKLKKSLKQKYLYKIAALATCLHLYRVATCRLLICIFIITILNHFTGAADILLFTVVADGCLVFGSSMSCFLMDKMKMRTLLFVGGILANMVLVALSISLYFFKLPWLNCALLGLFIVIVNAGPYPVLESLFGEIYPLELKTYCMVCFGVMGTILLFLSTKYALLLFELLGYHGVFLMNSVLGFLCLGYLWVFLPETKGKTLQEIELYFKNDKFGVVQDLLEDKVENLKV